MELTVEAVGETPAWLEPTRRDAARVYGELGLPTARDEEWRLTNLRPIRETSFDAPAPATVTADRLAAFDIEGLEGSRLVFVNGRFDGSLSVIDVPAEVVVCSLAEALATHETLVQPHLAKLAAWEDAAFTALNTASFEDGTFVHVPDGCRVDKPIHVVSLTTADEPTAAHPRTLIVAGAGSEATVIEDYVGLDDDVYLTNAVTEIVVGAEANVHHYFIERESRSAFHISTLCVRQEGRSDFTSHSVLLGGSIVRNDVHPVLDGEHCESTLNGLYIGYGSQLLDNHMRVEHAKPNCNSRQYYKGILDDDAHGVFTGRIVVAVDAQKTDAVQSNQSLLLSRDARAHAKPQLEIYADDVKCTHGATIGELDEQALFYLRARGLDAEAARLMLIQAFVGESLERMDVEPVRDWVGARLLERLEKTSKRRNVETSK